MKLSYLEEPELEFGGGRHVDIRFGIMNYGPLDFESKLAPKHINVGIVGTAETIAGVTEWFTRCRVGVAAKLNKMDPSKPNRQPNLFARFPGFSADLGFRSTLVLQEDLCSAFSKNDVAEIGRIGQRNERIRRSVDLFMEGVRYLAQSRHPDVIVCAVPLAMLEAMGPDEIGEEPEERAEENEEPHLDFHDMLKAGAMQQYRTPIQILLPSTYDREKARQQAKIGLGRELQDDATIAWNVHTAIYYKASGVPWRLPRTSSELTSCYVGVSFYRSLDRQSLLTSVAQVFNERGEGVVVRGGQASISKDDRQPHLPGEQAYDLLKNALASYRDTHKTFPARIVMHKSSRFDSDERSGFEMALRERSIATHDFVWVSNSGARLYRAGQYPPLRGTLLTLNDKEMVLYTRGSVPFFETYPGKYIPRPLRLFAESSEQTLHFLAQEILALTKMNWNNTQFDGSEPVTLRASRQCSNVLRYCREGRGIEPRYSFYM